MKNAIIFLLIAIANNLVFAGTVTVTNGFDRVVHLQTRTGAGDCSDKPTVAEHIFDGGEKLEISDVGIDVCYVYSFQKDIQSAPVGGGIIQPGKNISIAGTDFITVLEMTEEVVEYSDDTVANIHYPNSDVLDLLESVSPSISSEEAIDMASAVSAERKLASWTDPFTLPKTKLKCSKMASGRIPFDGKWKACVGHTLQCKKMKRELYAVASGPDLNDLTNALAQCAAAAGVVGSVSGALACFTTAGAGCAAGIAAAEKAFEVCMTAKIGAGIKVKFDNRGHWTGWGGC